MNKRALEYLCSLISKNINDCTIFEECELLKFYKLFENNMPLVVHEFSPVKIELYVLYHFSLIINSKCKTIEQKTQFMLKNVYGFLIIVLKSARKFLYEIITNAYTDSFEKYPKMYNSYFLTGDVRILRTDVSNIFFLEMFLNTDPLQIDNHYKYYASVFQLLLFTYLKSKSNELLIYYDHQLTLLEDNMHVSNRYKLFEDGIKLSQIHSLCDESETLKQIHTNFNDLRNRILPNDFQKLYSLVIDKNNTRDNKFLILKFNFELGSDSDEKISRIKDELPLIYKLLRSIKVKTKNQKTFSPTDRALIKKIIKEAICNKVELLIDKEYADIVSESISRNLESSISNGEFLDPFTLTILQIDTRKFVFQLRTFLFIILENLEVSELSYVG